MASRDGKAADPVTIATDEIGQTHVCLARALRDLLPQERHADMRFGFFAINDNVVAIAGLVVFMVLFGGSASNSVVDVWTPGRITVLAGTASLGVLAQAGFLLFFWRRAGLRFNYLGQTDALFSGDAMFEPADERSGAARHPQDTRETLLDVNALVSRGRLHLHCGYSQGLHRRDGIETLMDGWRDSLATLVEHVLSTRSDGGHVPADYPLMDLSEKALDDLLDTV